MREIIVIFGYLIPLAIIIFRDSSYSLGLKPVSQPRRKIICFPRARAAGYRHQYRRLGFF